MQNFPLITGYGQNYIKINNYIKISNNILLLSNGKYKNIDDDIKNINYLTVDSIYKLLTWYPLNKDIFLVGCGSKYIIPSVEIRHFIKSCGFNLEWMITSSAIHTWNILLEDYRDIIFLLIW